MFIIFAIIFVQSRRIVLCSQASTQRWQHCIRPSAFPISHGHLHRVRHINPHLLPCFGQEPRKAPPRNRSPHTLRPSPCRPRVHPKHLQEGFPPVQLTQLNLSSFPTNCPKQTTMRKGKRGLGDLSRIQPSHNPDKSTILLASF